MSKIRYNTMTHKNQEKLSFIDNEVVVAVSGGFDPVHEGHCALINEAKKLGDKLVVILNNDNWLRQKKGYCFMNEKSRATILYNLKAVDWVHITTHKENDDDVSVCKALEELKPDIFANGGDRKYDNVPEIGVCDKLGIKMRWNVGGEKINSSSELVKNCESIINKPE